MKILKYLLFIALGLAIGFGIKAWTKMAKYSSGEIAPDFTSTTPDGQSMSLSDFKGQVVLLSFWGSWCGPCRDLNKEMVPLYHKYKDVKIKDAKGFTIFSVGMEKSKERWLKAIEKDGLIWPNHVSDLQRMNGAAGKKYGVWEIPTEYLIDEKGHIIMTNPTIKEVDNWLSKRLLQ